MQTLHCICISLKTTNNGQLVLTDTNIWQIHIDIILSYKKRFWRQELYLLTIFIYNIFQNIIYYLFYIISLLHIL